MLYQLSYGGHENSGAEGNRTPDLSVANAALSQLSYGPSGVLETATHMGATGLAPPILRDSYTGPSDPPVGATGFEPVTSTMST